MDLYQEFFNTRQQLLIIILETTTVRRFHKCRTGQSEVNFLLKSMCQYRRTFLDSYIWTFYSNLKHNSHKE